MNKLQELIKLCECSVSVEVNAHRDVYMTAYKYLVEANLEGEDRDIVDEMVLRDFIIEIQFYPNTPVGFYKVWHYDLDMALDECLEIIKENNEKWKQ